MRGNENIEKIKERGKYLESICAYIYNSEHYMRYYLTNLS